MIFRCEMPFLIVVLNIAKLHIFFVFLAKTTKNFQIKECLTLQKRQNDMISRCSSTIFTPSRIRITPPAISALDL